jgi:hypothetical protein
VARASSRVLILTRLDPCLIHLIVTQWAMGLSQSSDRSVPSFSLSNARTKPFQEFGRVRSVFVPNPATPSESSGRIREEFGRDFRLIRLLSLDLLHFLSSCFEEFHELVSAFVPNTNWETQVEELVRIIRDGREKMPESLPSLVPSPDPSLFPSLTETRVPPSPARVVPESRPSPREDAKSRKKTREDSARVPPESSESSEEGKT